MSKHRLNFQALRVEFLLKGAMTEPVYPIHLDSVLAWSAVEQAKRNGSEFPLTAMEYLPLEKYSYEEDFVWCASAFHLEKDENVSVRYQTKKTNIEDIAHNLKLGLLRRAPNKLDLQRGPHRLALYPEHRAKIYKAKAWCIGDSKQIEVLLSNVRYLGAKIRNGLGEIAECAIYEDQSAHEQWRQRVLPWEEEGYLQLVAGYKPPYWDKAQHKLCSVSVNVL